MSFVPSQNRESCLIELHSGQVRVELSNSITLWVIVQWNVDSAAMHFRVYKLLGADFRFYLPSTHRVDDMMEQRYRSDSHFNANINKQSLNQRRWCLSVSIRVESALTRIMNVGVCPIEF